MRCNRDIQGQERHIGFQHQLAKLVALGKSSLDSCMQNLRIHNASNSRVTRNGGFLNEEELEAGCWGPGHHADAGVWSISADTYSV
ncbi:MAG: hypothetical protein M1816_007680 [Peltula sp. TS41687]|nr:MAG: hypothetical protein M1816_007680 [Peltula sp. TS41687]